MTMKTVKQVSIGLMLCWTFSAAAETFYLRDGSILTGRVVEETEIDVLITNDLYGDLLLQKQDVLLQESEDKPDQVETYTIAPDGTAVICRLQRPVPDVRADSNSFNLLIPGDVQAVTDANGLDVPFTQRSIGENSLITIQTDALLSDTFKLTITTLQQGLVTVSPSGQLVFRLNYTLNQSENLRVIITFPVTFHLQSRTPEPTIELDGLIVWDKPLQRQQHFTPEIVFTP